MKKLYVILIACFLFTTMGCSCNKEKMESTMGVWWWEDTLDDNYLEFASNNGINEIYYCSGFSSSTSDFISKANKKGIDVYWLAGEYQWITNPSALYTKIESYLEFQETSKYKFKGVHLDIEPHQSENWDNQEQELVEGLVVLAKELSQRYQDINIDYDIPFWLDHLVTIGKEEKEAYKWMIDYASRIFIMSYRDSAEAIYDISSEELEYAASINKSVILGIETYSTEGDKVSFYEEGKGYMYKEIDRLKKMISKRDGISIHHIRKWYELKS